MPWIPLESVVCHSITLEYVHTVYQGLSNGMDDATSYKQTKQGIISRQQLLPLESEGVRRALDFIQSGNFQHITPQAILELHRVAFGPIFDWAGSWRTGPATFGNLEGVAFFEITVLIQEYCRDLEERLRHLPPRSETEAYLRELVTLLAWAQHRFVVIHPFGDYNGRIGRLLTNAILYLLDLPFLELRAETEEDRKQYIQALRNADQLDFSSLESLMYDALREALQKHIS